MHDLLIRGALVFDGQGNPAVIADVAIDQGKVTAIGKITGSAHEIVEATGLALMPGRGDLHTHYDAQITWDKTMSPSPALGVTTAVIGNCGFGIAPCPANLRETMLKNLSVVEGMDLQALLTGVNWEFETFGQDMDQLRQIGPYLNTAVFAKNCENKAKPALHCNGKCQMMKKMQETEKREQQLPERKSDNKIEIFYCNTKYHNFEKIFSEILPSQVVTEENNLLKDISLSLFRPPQRA